MDIYGYPSYQYDQSGELTKQMYAHQALTSPIPYGRNIPEPHVMPAPSTAPWNMQGLPWGMPSPPEVVQFTGQPNQLASKITSAIHCKRKSLDVEPAIPSKLLITDEKMAAHLNGLHISSDFTPHMLAEENMDLGMDPSVAITNKLKGHTIVLSDEVKKLKDEPLLPATLLERLEKPQMSLVVWKPREDILEKIKEEKKEEIDKQPNISGLEADSVGMDVEM